MNPVLMSPSPIIHSIKPFTSGLFVALYPVHDYYWCFAPQPVGAHFKRNSLIPMPGKTIPLVVVTPVLDSELRVPEAPRDVVVHQPGSLQVSVHNGRTDELEAALFEVGANAVGQLGAGRYP